MTMYGLDYTNLPPAAAKKLGATFVVRYLGTSSKCIGPVELAGLHKLGIAVGFWSEGTGVEFRGGHAAGQAQGAKAQAAAQKLGVPTGVPIWFAVDTDTADYALVNEYLAGCQIGAPDYDAKLYGSFGVVQNAPGEGHAQTYAWSGGKLSAKAGLYQYHNGSTYDHDRTTPSGPAVRNGWLVYGHVAPPAPVSPVAHPVAATRDRMRLAGNRNARAAAAVKYEAGQVHSGAASWKDLCAKLVRVSYGVPASAWNSTPRTAAGAWSVVPSGARHTWYSAPYGVPVYWTGGSSGAGHVAIADGLGNCWSNDFGPSGYVGDGKVRLVPIASISKHDAALKLVGWSETYLGARVYG